MSGAAGLSNKETVYDFLLAVRAACDKHNLNA
jgi:hypothetical protein